MKKSTLKFIVIFLVILLLFTIGFLIYWYIDSNKILEEITSSEQNRYSIKEDENKLTFTIYGSNNNQEHIIILEDGLVTSEIVKIHFSTKIHARSFYQKYNTKSDTNITLANIQINDNIVSYTETTNIGITKQQLLERYNNFNGYIKIEI